MLYHDRMDVFEEINIRKTSALKYCDICHYWKILDKGVMFQPWLSRCVNYVCEP